jgi:HAMP domain-containing protein
MQKSFLQSLLIKVSSLCSVIFLLVGLVFLYASHFGADANNLVGLLLTTVGALLGGLTLVFMNVTLTRVQNELKESVQLAHQISQGDVSEDFNEDEFDENHELKSLLSNIGYYLKEKADIADKIAKGV